MIQLLLLFSCFMCKTQRTVRSPIHDMLSGIALIISHMQSPTLCMMTVRVQNEDMNVSWVNEYFLKIN